MSTEVPICNDCHVPCSFEGLVRGDGAGAGEGSYGVTWRCVACGELQPVDVCTRGSEPAALDVAGDAIDAALAAAAKGLVQRAFAILDAVLAREPENARAWAEEARLHHSLGFVDATVRSYERALAITDSPIWRIALGCVLHDARRFADAVAVYAPLTSAAPSEWTAIALANQANALVALGLHADADSSFQRAIALEPLRVMHHYNLARSLLVQQRWADAGAAVAQGIAADPAPPFDASLLVMAAVAFNQEGRHADGLAAAEAALAKDPNHPQALQQKAYALELAARM